MKIIGFLCALKINFKGCELYKLYELCRYHLKSLEIT